MSTQDGLDLAGLDAEAADLDLLVDAAEELDRAVRQPARQVAGSVKARARRAVQTTARAGLRGEGIGHEALRREIRPAEVAARQAVAAGEQLAGHPRR